MRRRALHRRIGDVLAASPNPDPDAVAHHFQQAGDERAAAWLVRAGERAQRAYAWLMAVERYEAAAQLMEAAGADAGERGWLMHRIAFLLRHADPRRALTTLDEVERLATQAGDRGLAAQMQGSRGFIRCILGDHRRGLADLKAEVDGLDAMAADDYERLRARLATESIPLDPNHGRGTFAIRLTRVGRYAEARQIAEHVVANAPPPGEIIERGGSFVGDAYNALIEIYGAQGLPERAEWAFTQALATYRAAEHHMLVQGSSMYAMRWLFLPYRAEGVAERRRVAAEAVAANRRTGGAGGNVPPQFASLALLFTEGEWTEINRATPALLGPITLLDLTRAVLGPLARAQGDTDQAWEYVRGTLPHGLATEPGETEFMPAVAIQRLAAALALDAGDRDTARAWLEAHDRWLAWDGVVLGQSEGQALWARYYRSAGDIDRATAHAQQALAHATEPRQPLALLAAHRLLGALNTDAERYEDAAMHLAESLALADACAVPYERALTLLVTAELRAATGDVETARALLDDVRTICTHLNARLALARADQIDARLAASRQRTPAHPAGLTAREVEVLRLIATGKTNREIADTLFLSPATVNIHVTHILTKTNTANRAEAATFALRHGLA
jgi:DNA-binding CsgD family transcriptional regulator